ncbi:hypothetical protein L195_g061844, partial [Trifolium pratense]
RPGYRQYSPLCIPVIDGSGCSYFGCYDWSYLTLSGSFEGLHSLVTSLA